ncbi:MAG: arginase family protein, partial [Geminicoccaceae bacterium]|nr:arginase family protein [Geminicoccaceae bacterium]
VFDIAPQAGQLVDYGDLALPNTSLERMREALEPLARELMARHHMLWLGGDHSITLPLLRAYRAQVGEPLALVHFDAHCDTWPDHFGEPSGHGTWVREAVAEGLIDPRATTQIGIRSAATREVREFIAEQGGRIFTARELRGRESVDQLTEVAEHVRAATRGRPTYLTLDIDVLDPAFAPGTGTPEPGGLSTNQVLTLVEAWADLPWVGMDLCEVSPPFDHAELTSNAASVLAWTYLCGRFCAAR